MLFNASEMGWKGIPLERTEEGTEDLRETFVLPQYTHNEHWVWSDSFFKFHGETRFVGIDCVLSVYVTAV
jgi:hypothetical protein